MRVQFTATTAEKLDTVPKIDGQIVAVLDKLGYYYDYNGVRYQVNDGGSFVEFIQALPEGTKVGSIDIDGTTTDLYAPTPPTKVSELSNNVGFVTNLVSNLLNYYTKADTYNKSEVDALVATVQGIKFQYVDELPTEDIQTNVIYLVPKDVSTTSNAKYEYINTTGDSTGWELIGDTEIDLSSYVKKAELDAILQDYALISDIPTKTSDLTNDSNFISDPDYVHTDNNFTDEDVTKLESATAVSVQQILTRGTEIATITINEVDTPIYSSAGLLPRIIVTTEDGSIVTATDGIDTINATQIDVGQYQLDVTDYGTWTVMSEYEGESASVTVEIDAVKIYRVALSYLEIPLTITFPSGSTGYFGKQGEAPVAVTENPFTYIATSSGTYVATVTYSGTTYTTEIEVDSSVSEVSTFCPEPHDPDLSANVVNTWLMYGNVSGTYASLAAVLNDTAALAQLASSEFAMDYMLRSTSWMSDICASTNALNAINANNMAAEKFLCNDTWYSYLYTQTGNWMKLTAINPQMTSDTTPSGRVIYDSQVSGKEAYKLFIGGSATSNRWQSDSSSNTHYIGYDEEDSNVLITNFQFKIMLYNTGLTPVNKNATLQASIDGTTWEDIDVVESTITSYDITYNYYTASKLREYRAVRYAFKDGSPLANQTYIAGLMCQVFAHKFN